MYLTPEQIVGANKAGMEALIGLASSQFAALERLSTLNTNATKAAFEEGLARAKSLLGAKDAQEYFSLNATVTQPNLEKAIAYSRSVYEVAAQTQGEIAKYVEARAAEFSKNLLGILDKASKNAPAGSDVAVAAVKTALAAASTAYDSFSKVAKQATEMAEANFTAATAPVKEKKHAAAA
jgi:phasin family protein